MEKRSSIIQKGSSADSLAPQRHHIQTPKSGPPSEMMQFCLEKTYSDVDFIWKLQFGNFNLSQNVTVKYYFEEIKSK